MPPKLNHIPMDEFHLLHAVFSYQFPKEDTSLSITYQSRLLFLLEQTVEIARNLPFELLQNNLLHKKQHDLFPITYQLLDLIPYRLRSISFSYIFNICSHIISFLLRFLDRDQTRFSANEASLVHHSKKYLSGQSLPNNENRLPRLAGLFYIFE